MGGLVPLILASSATYRPSSAFTSPEFPSSCMTFPSFRSQSPIPYKPRRPSVDMTISTTLGTSAPAPATSDEWKKAIDEVKFKYTNRKYRACSARCIELLADSKRAKVEPVYLVSLHFYAAVSLETCARPLSPTSAFRTKLLRDARHHYDQAETLIKAAEDVTVLQTRSDSSLSDAPRTPDLYHDSQSEISTSPSSPRSSIGSLDGAFKKTIAKPKKKVSFTGLPDVEIPTECPPEPFIRPDSPTLGLEEFNIFNRQSDTLTKVPDLETFPLPPTSPNKDQKVDRERPSSPPADMGSETGIEVEDTLDLAKTENMNRLCAQMSSMRSQIIFHRNAIDSLLSAPVEAQPTPEVPPLPTDNARCASPFRRPPTTTRFEMVRPRASTPTLDAHQSNFTATSPDSPGSTFFNDDDDDASNDTVEIYSGMSTPDSQPSTPRSTSSMSMYSVGRPGTSMSMRSRPESAASNSRGGDDALRQRIERLRANGWQRKRFDGRRYEALRESVMDELKK